MLNHGKVKIDWPCLPPLFDARVEQMLQHVSPKLLRVDARREPRRGTQRDPLRLAGARIVSDGMTHKRTMASTPEPALTGSMQWRRLAREHASVDSVPRYKL